MNIAWTDARAVTLVAAIQAGDTASLQQQLREHPELAAAQIIDHCGVSRSLLHVAADWPGHFPNGAQSVVLLAAAGADVNARVTHAKPGSAPETPLHWAASSDDVSVLDALLDAGADIEAPGAVFTDGPAMSDAVVFAQWNAARRLLERGAATTIWQAAALGLLDRVRELCALEPAPSPDEISNAFWNACRGGQIACAAFLLDRGADLHWVGHDGKMPADAAREGGDAAMLEWLRAHGAKRA